MSDLLKALKKMRACLEEQNIHPDPVVFEVSLTEANAIVLAKQLGSEWSPDGNGVQVIGQYRISTPRKYTLPQGRRSV